MPGIENQGGRYVDAFFGDGPLPDPADTPVDEPDIVAQFPATDEFLASMALDQPANIAPTDPGASDPLAAPPGDDYRPLRATLDGTPVAPTLDVSALEYPLAATMQAGSIPSDPLPAPPDHTSTLGVQPLTLPEPVEETSLGRLLGGYSTMNGEEIAQSFAEDDAAKAAHFANEKASLIADDQAAENANTSRYEHARKIASAKASKLEESMNALAEQHVDPGRWARSRSGLQLAAGYLGAALSGFLSVRGGGQNSTIALIMHSIDQDISAQKADIANKRGALGQRANMLSAFRESLGDEYHAAEAVRVVRLRQAEQLLTSEASQYDPNGTTARNIIEMRSGLRAAAEHKQEAMKRELFEREMQIGDQDIKRHAELRQQRKLDHDIRLDDWKRSRHGRAKRVLTPAQQLALSKSGYLPTLDADGHIQKNPDAPDDALAQKQKADLERVRTGVEKDNRELQADDMAIRDPSSGKKFIQDGEPWRTGAHKEISVAIAQTQIAARIVDKIKILKKKYGGASKWLETGEYSEMQALVKKLDMDNSVQLGLGAISKDDLIQLAGYRGGVDADSYLLDATKGLETMAENMVESTNTRMRSAGWKGEPWHPIRSTLAKAYERSKQDLMSEISSPVAPGLESGAIDDARTNIGVLLSRDDITRADITEIARKLNDGVGRGYDKETAKELTLRMADKYSMIEETSLYERNQFGPSMRMEYERQAAKQILDSDRDDMLYREILAGDE